MKIVDEKPYGIEFNCQACKSQLIAEIDDVKVGYFGANYGGDVPTRQYYVECPVCGTHRILKYSELTPKVRETADRKEKRQ